MFLILAVVLWVLWWLGVFAFHLTDFAIHVLLLAALITFAIHLVSSRRSSV